MSGGSPGTRVVFAGRHELPTEKGRRLVLAHQDQPTGLQVQSIYETFGEIPVVRRSTKVMNGGAPGRH